MDLIIVCLIRQNWRTRNPAQSLGIGRPVAEFHSEPMVTRSTWRQTPTRKWRTRCWRVAATWSLRLDRLTPQWPWPLAGQERKRPAAVTTTPMQAAGKRGWGGSANRTAGWLIGGPEAASDRSLKSWRGARGQVWSRLVWRGSRLRWLRPGWSGSWWRALKPRYAQPFYSTALWRQLVMCKLVRSFVFYFLHLKKRKKITSVPSKHRIFSFFSFFSRSSE